jgi:hypothetical protein
MGYAYFGLQSCNVLAAINGAGKKGGNDGRHQGGIRSMAEKLGRHPGENFTADERR